MDESGNFNYNDISVISILATKNVREIQHCIKRTRNRKLSKKQKRKNIELKGSNVTDKVLRYALKQIEKCDCQIFAIISKNTEIDKSVNESYNENAGKLIKTCCKKVNVRELIVDRRNNRKTQYAFNNYIKGIVGNLKIRHEDSKKEKGIQAIDLIAYAIRLKYKNGKVEFYDLIKDKIVWINGP